MAWGGFPTEVNEVHFWLLRPCFYQFNTKKKPPTHKKKKPTKKNNTGNLRQRKAECKEVVLKHQNNVISINDANRCLMSGSYIGNKVP